MLHFIVFSQSRAASFSLRRIFSTLRFYHQILPCVFIIISILSTNLTPSLICRDILSLTPSHPFPLHSFPSRYVFYVHFAFPVTFSVCLHERRGHFYPPPSFPLQINPPATRGLFVHLEANVPSHGIIHDLVNINKCIFPLSSSHPFSLLPSLSLSFSLSLSLSLFLFRSERSITLPSPARRRACTHACVHARMLLTRTASTHARTHARCTRGKWVTLLMVDRPAGRPVDAGCWHLRVYLLPAMTATGMARWRVDQGGIDRYRKVCVAHSLPGGIDIARCSRVDGIFEVAIQQAWYAHECVVEISNIAIVSTGE